MPYSGPAAPPTVEMSVVANSLRTSPVSRPAVRRAWEDGLEAAVHVLAVVAVADLPVEGDQLDPVLGERLGRAA